MTGTATDRRRLCFVLPSLAGGGAERAAVQLLNALDGARWERSMYLFRREGPYLAELASDIRLSAGESASRLGRWRELRRFIADTKPDLVMSFLSYVTVLSAARVASGSTRVVFAQNTPVSAFLEDADYGWRRPLRRRLFTAVTRLGYAAADLVIASSRGVAQDLTAAFGVHPDCVRVIPNPVDIESVRAAAREAIEPRHAAEWGTPAIVAAGRLADVKNYALLIEALALVRARVPARLFVLGQGEREPALRQLAADRGVGDAITWCGFQGNPWKYMARADVFALTSRYEGFGNVLVEAMACGVPVIATRSAGTADIISDGVDGVLVARHTPDAVAAALTRLLLDRPLRDRMAVAARDSSERFARPVVARAYDRALAEALA
jgi:glycosyltransferase involved in cell wall biosynthesis